MILTDGNNDRFTKLLIKLSLHFCCIFLSFYLLQSNDLNIVLLLVVYLSRCTFFFFFVVVVVVSSLFGGKASAVENRQSSSGSGETLSCITIKICISATKPPAVIDTRYLIPLGGDLMEIDSTMGTMKQQLRLANWSTLSCHNDLPAQFSFRHILPQSAEIKMFKFGVRNGTVSWE